MTTYSRFALVLVWLTSMAFTVLAQAVEPAGPATTKATTQALNPEIPLKPDTWSQPHTLAIIQLEGEINDYTRDDLFQRFTAAKAMGATAVIIEVNSPAGRSALRWRYRSSSSDSPSR